MPATIRPNAIDQPPSDRTIVGMSAPAKAMANIVRSGIPNIAPPIEIKTPLIASHLRQGLAYRVLLDESIPKPLDLLFVSIYPRGVFPGVCQQCWVSYHYSEQSC